MGYEYEIIEGESEKSIISKIIKRVRSEWKIKEVVKSSPGFSVIYEDEFEDGNKICYFVKKGKIIYYCGPINVQKKKMVSYSLWMFDYIFYLNNEICKIENISYTWATLSSKKIPEDMIFNPCVAANLDGNWQLLKAKALYSAENIRDIVIVDMKPSSDDVSNKWFTLTFFKNGKVINKKDYIYDFEPSLLQQNIFLYKKKDANAYTQYDYCTELECLEKISISEATVRWREEDDFWRLLYWGSDGRHLENKQTKKKYLFEKRIKAQTIGYHEYYVTVNNSIVEIVVKNYFSKCAEVEELSAMFEDDFSHNYRVRIPDEKKEEIYLWLYLCRERLISAPSVCGVEISKIIDCLKKSPYIENKAEVEKVIKIIKEKSGKSKYDIVENWMLIYPYKALLSNSDYLRYRNSTEQAEYYYVCENLDIMRKAYSRILQELAEEGKINPKWRSEFSLFMLVKSYFPNTIYQYRSIWLAGQSLDIFVPEISMGIEYQGLQHYEAVDIFGGEEGLKSTKRRDEIKREKCKEQGVKLVEWNYETDITDANLINLLNDLHIEVPPKKYVEFSSVREKA